MTLFVGGPYDGRDLPISTELCNSIRLPEVLEWDQGDPDATVPRPCPHLYALDNNTIPPRFVFVETASPPKKSA